MRTARLFLVPLMATLLSPMAAATAGTRVDAIRAKDRVTCGVVERVPGFTRFEDGRAVGFEPDLCRAIAAAILGAADKVEFVPADSVDDFRADSTVDVVARRLTLTLQRDTMAGMTFGPVVFYDGAALMVRSDGGIAEVAALDGKKICERSGSEAAEALARHFSLKGWHYAPEGRATFSAATEAFLAGACTALIGDISELGAVRYRHPNGATILPPLLSKEPLAFLMRDDDPEFVSIVRWTMFALIAAEELGVTAASVATPSADPDVQRLLGVHAGNGKSLGLDERWAATVIQSVGNYGEIFDRHLGTGSPYRMERGLNALWSAGGLMYAPPLR